MPAIDRPARPLDAETLLAQAGWVRRLALRLVGDPAAADDVVQETWVAALERPPAARGLRAWLSVVVRNLALRRGRREGLRRDVERAAARREAIAGAEQALERMQLQRALADAVLALDEPYRSAVILRHLDGLGCAEIARRQRCTPAAARQRVSRGLARLRAELDARSGGDRGAWCSALGAAWDLGRAGPPAPVASAVGLMGGMFVGVKTIAVVAGLGLAAGALVWMQREARPVEVRPVGPASAQPSEVRPAAAPGPGEPAPVRWSEDPASEPRRSPAPALAPIAGDDERITGRVVDVRGRPLAGASVVWLRPAGAADEQPLTSTETDSEGRFRLASDAPSVASGQASIGSLLVELEGFLPAGLEARPGPDLEVVLSARPRVAGRLLDPDGQPCRPPGRVQLSVVDPDGERHDTGVEIDADGRWETSDLVPGRLVNVWGRAKGWGAGGSDLDLELPAGALEHLDVQVSRGVVVRGVVLDAASGEPVPFAQVWAESWHYDTETSEPTTVADGAGRFELLGVDPGQVIGDGAAELFWLRVTAQAEGYVGRPFDGTVARARSDGAFFVELEIQPALASLAGLVIWPGGEPASGVLMYTIDGQRNFHFAATGPEGRFEVVGLPAGELALLARADGEPAVAGAARPRSGKARADLAIRSGQHETVELVLQASDCALEGRVTDLAGRPLDDVVIGVGEHLAVPGLTVGLAHHEARTDAAGRFRLEGLLPGRFQVEIDARSLEGKAARPDHRPVDLEPGATMGELDFVLAEAVVVRGWVDAGERGLEGLSVELRPIDDGEALESREPASDGSFAFEGLFPDGYDVVLVGAEDELLARVSCGAGGARGLVLAAP